MLEDMIIYELSPATFIVCLHWLQCIAFCDECMLLTNNTKRNISLTIRGKHVTNISLCSTNITICSPTWYANHSLSHVDFHSFCRERWKHIFSAVHISSLCFKMKIITIGISSFAQVHYTVIKCKLHRTGKYERGSKTNFIQLGKWSNSKV